MRHAIYILLIALLALFAQGAMLQVGIPAYLMPEFVTILIVYLAFNEASVATVMLVFVLGLLMDFSSAVLIGPWAGAGGSDSGAHDSGGTPGAFQRARGHFHPDDVPDHARFFLMVCRTVDQRAAPGWRDRVLWLLCVSRRQADVRRGDAR